MAEDQRKELAVKVKFCGLPCYMQERTEKAGAT
jgi:hypothetical protein